MKLSSCSAIFNTIRQNIFYFGDMSNLHGVGYVFSMSNIPHYKRFFWSIILSMCCFGAWTILRSSFELLSNGGAAYAVETNYLEWNTPFPAITVCKKNDDEAVKGYLRRYELSTNLNEFLKDVSFWNLKYCASCTICKLNDSCVEDFSNAVIEIRQGCHQLFTECSFGGSNFRCCDKFKPIDTEFGTCFVFNSALSQNNTLVTVNTSVGVPDLVFYVKKVVEVMIHSSEDIISGGMTNILPPYVPLVTEINAILRVEQTINSDSVKTLSKNSRGCLFKDERPPYHDWPFAYYTRSSCILFCRAIAQIKRCNCTHHFLAKIVRKPVCDIKGLDCLFKNRSAIVDVIKNKCPCPIACEETVYEGVHVFSKRVSNKMTEEQNLGSMIKISLANLPTMRVRRLAITTPFKFVVDVGGVGGVFFGASLLSIIELIYLLCIRRN